jgi:uncharacterized protein (TIGR02246 family)
MRTQILLTLITLFLLIGGSNVPVAAQNSDDQKLLPCPECNRLATDQDIEALFERWNQSLQTGDPYRVAANYAEKSILLATLSNKPCITQDEKVDYFKNFLEKMPSGKIDMRMINISCNMAVDSGLYTFTFLKTGETAKARYTFVYKWDGKQWLIISHHSSLMPEK